MDARDRLAGEFEAHRPKMTAVARRLLGSAVEADDAVQEAWIRLDRADRIGIDNLEAWLMTTVGRIALNMLRTRSTRREMPLDQTPSPSDVESDETEDPELEVLLADSVGAALQVVMATLTPAERVAYVLHEVFAFPFAEIGRVLTRSPEAARALASRARRRLRGLEPDTADEHLGAAEQQVVRAFLAAARHGDIEGLLSVLAPDVTERIGGPDGHITTVGGARRVASRAREFAVSGLDVRPAWVAGWPGWIAYLGGAILSVGAFDITDGQITRMDVIIHPGRHIRLRTAEN